MQQNDETEATLSERLRKFAGLYVGKTTDGLQGPTVRSMAAEAADELEAKDREIERLREKLKHGNHEAANYCSTLLQYGECSCDDTPCPGSSNGLNTEIERLRNERDELRKGEQLRNVELVNAKAEIERLRAAITTAREKLHEAGCINPERAEHGYKLQHVDAILREALVQ